MNHHLRRGLAVLTLSAVAVSSAFGAHPGQVDFDKLPAGKRGKVVEVSVGKGLLKFASFFVRHEEPEAAALISSLSSVRVNVVSVDDSNREAVTDRMAAMRRKLKDDGWEQIVTVSRPEEGEDVAIFVKQRDEEMIDGVVVTVIDARKREAVMVNVVGRIKAEQLATLGKHIDLDGLHHTKRIKRS